MIVSSEISSLLAENACVAMAHTHTHTQNNTRYTQLFHFSFDL